MLDIRQLKILPPLHAPPCQGLRMGVLLGSAGTCLGSWIKVSTMVESQLIILCLDWSGVRDGPGPVVGGLLGADGGGGQPDLHPGHPRPAGRHLVPAKPDEHRHLHRGVRQPGESRGGRYLSLERRSIRRFVITDKAPTRAFRLDTLMFSIVS